jgi:hypothetical protein
MTKTQLEDYRQELMDMVFVALEGIKVSPIPIMNQILLLQLALLPGLYFLL